MGNKLVILKVSNPEFEGDVNELVHSEHFFNGELITSCGIDLCFDVRESDYVEDPVTCKRCIKALETRGKFVKKGGKWY